MEIKKIIPGISGNIAGTSYGNPKFPEIYIERISLEIPLWNSSLISGNSDNNLVEIIIDFDKLILILINILNL